MAEPVPVRLADIDGLAAPVGGDGGSSNVGLVLVELEVAVSIWELDVDGAGAVSLAVESLPIDRPVFASMSDLPVVDDVSVVARCAFVVELLEVDGCCP